MIFCYLIADNQTKCGIIYKKIAMQVGDDKQRINYEWPKLTVNVRERKQMIKQSAQTELKNCQINFL